MAQQEDFTIDQGSNTVIKLELTNEDGARKDLTGFTAAAQIRKTYSSSDSSAVSFTPSFESPRSTGVLNLQLTHVQTNALKSGRYVYDIELTNQDSAANTIVERILEGQITISPSVTRS